jgi:hypothetical protein
MLEPKMHKVRIDSYLVSFLYQLLRDHIAPGDLEDIMLLSVASDIIYDNGFLAEYAENVAKRLGDKPIRLSMENL